MLGNLRGASPSSEPMSESAAERNRAEKALITRTPNRSQVFMNKTNLPGVKNYSDKNGNDVTKTVGKGRKTFAFWTLVVLLFVLAIGNLVLTFTILAVLRLGQGMESMEFLPEHNAIKLFGDTAFEHVYKKDGLIESFRDEPMSIVSENGSVVINLQTRSESEYRKSQAQKRNADPAVNIWDESEEVSSDEEAPCTSSKQPTTATVTKPKKVANKKVKKVESIVEASSDEEIPSPPVVKRSSKSKAPPQTSTKKKETKKKSRLTRSDTKLLVNTSGVFVRGVSSLDLVDPASGQTVFSTSSPQMNIPDGVKNLHAKQVSTKRVTSPVDQDLVFRSEGSAHLRGAEGAHMESRELLWSADQDIYLNSINGSIVLSGKEGVFIDVRYLPIAMPMNTTEKPSASTGQYKVCVCMPQGKLFRIAVRTGQKIACSHVHATGDMNPCA